MAITDYISATLPGASPAAATNSPISLFALKMAYEQGMLKQMQQPRSLIALSAARQTTLEGYEKRIDRWNKTTLQQRMRTAFIGDDVGGVASKETGIRTVVIRGQHWEHPEFFDMRDNLGTMGMLNAMVPGGAYQENVLAALGRKADSVFLTELIASVQLGDGGGSSSFSGTVSDGTRGSNNGTSSTAVTTFNFAKAIDLINVLQRNDAFYDVHVAIHPIQVQQLFNDTTNRATSFDYNSARPLMSGEVTNLLGARWIMSTEVPAVADIDSVTTGSQAGHRVYAWNANAMVFGMGRQEAWAKQVVSRGNTELVYHGAFLGAVRVDDLGVTYVNCID